MIKKNPKMNNENKDENKAKTSYDKLKDFIGDEIENMTIIEANPINKSPKGEWKNYYTTSFEAKNTKGNIGAIFRENDKHKYAFIDIDGFKKHPKQKTFYLKDKDNNKFKEELLNIFKNCPAISDYSIIQKTQSGGYHIIFKHEEKKRLGNSFMNSFKLPQTIKKEYNIPSDNLGAGSESGAIELFLNDSSKFIILAPSRYGKKKYEILHVGSKFGTPIKNVKNQIKKAMKQAGYKYKATKQPKNEKEVKESKKTKEIIRDDEKVKKFIEDTTVFNLMVKEFKNQTGNHNRILGHCTSILLAIGLNEEETKKYMQKILDSAENNTSEHRKQINDYIKGNNGTKPNYSKHLKNKELIEYLNKYFKQFKERGGKGIKDEIIFGLDVKKENSYYVQDENGIKYVSIIRNGDTPRITKIANLEIKNITMIIDELKLFDPVYNITYNNLTINREITKEYLTSQQLIEEIQNAKVLYNPKEIEIKTLINCFIIDGREYNRVEVKNEAYLKGFWMVDNRVISNTEIKDLEYNKEDLKKAIKLLNEVMSDRSEEGKRNDSAVYRFMLYSPFSYCLKQLGYGDGNYSLILIGASQTNKSGSIKIANHFYNHTEEETAGSTVSVLGSKLEENSFPAVFDECDHLFKLAEANNVMKRAIYEKTARATKDRNDNKKIDEFKALGLPFFLLNEPQEFKDYIINRYKIIEYTNQSIISDLDKQQFNKKYIPKSQHSQLTDFNPLGKAFSEKMIKILEDSTQHNKLFEIENTITEILKEISEEAGVEFRKEMYETTKAGTNYNYDVKEDIRRILNEEFKKKNKLIANQEYTSYSFINSIKHNDFPFIYYNRNRTELTKNKHFVVSCKKMEEWYRKRIDEHIEIELILEALKMVEILQKRADEKNKEYSDYIQNNRENIIVDGKNKNIRGAFYVDTDTLIKKIFSMNLDLSESNDNEIVN